MDSIRIEIPQHNIKLCMRVLQFIRCDKFEGVPNVSRVRNCECRTLEMYIIKYFRKWQKDEILILRQSKRFKVLCRAKIPKAILKSETLVNFEMSRSRSE